MRKPLVALAALALLQVGCGADEALVDEDLNDAWLELAGDDGSADSSNCSGVIVPDRGPFDNQIALTFDDGPSLANTPRVLEVLRAHGAHATFFINGQAVTSEAHMDLLRRMREEGHIIGNHTETHQNAVSISLDRLRREVSQTGDVLDEIGVPARQRFLRFPYGSSNCSTADVARSAGYRITGWHIDTADWCFNAGGGYCSPSTFRYVPDSYRRDYVGFTVSQARSNGGGVLLMHDVHSFTVNNLDRLLTALENAGFTFVTLDDAGVFPLLNGATPGNTPWIGSPCAGSDECGFSIGGASGFCYTFEDENAGESRGFCALPCEGYCPDRAGYATSFCTEVPAGGSGMCVSRSESLNDSCAAIPGTAPVDAERYIGSSGAPARTATVCMP